MLCESLPLGAHIQLVVHIFLHLWFFPFPGGSGESSRASTKVGGQQVDEFGQLVKKERFQPIDEVISWIKYDPDFPDWREV